MTEETKGWLRTKQQRVAAVAVVLILAVETFFGVTDGWHGILELNATWAVVAAIGIIAYEIVRWISKGDDE